MEYKLYFDGSCINNPNGQSTSAFVLFKDGVVLVSKAIKNGIGSSNQSEYNGLIVGLKECLKRHIVKVDVLSDSMLVVQQMKGNWRVKNPRIKELYEEAKFLEEQIGDVQYRWINREENWMADELAGEELESCMGGVRLVGI
jgi:ribonuclease HI